MERETNLYGVKDMVRAATGDCKGCSGCCEGMGNSIILDPFDIYEMTTELSLSMEQLLADKIELNLVDGLILPNLKMTEKGEKCAFLNEEGRCGIHTFRPGLCRSFPLGRQYENGVLSYFLLEGACPVAAKSKVKIEKWIGIRNSFKYQKFLVDWHEIRKSAEYTLMTTKDEQIKKTLNMQILNLFFVLPYERNTDFYEQFEMRVKKLKESVTL